MQPEWLLISKPVRPPFRDGTTVLARDLVRGLDPAFRLRYLGDPAQPQRENGHVLQAAAMAYAPGIADKARSLGAILAHPSLPLHLMFTPSALTTSILAALRRVQPGRRIVLTLTSSTGAVKLARRLRGLDVVVHSQHAREALVRAELEPSRVRCIYPGVSAAAPIPDPAGAKRLLYAGDLDAAVVARLLTLARALGDRPELEGWSLTIASRPKDEGHHDLLHELRACLPTKDRVELLGEVADMDALFRRSSLQVFCADHVRRKVDVPLVLLEGCARGLPLVAIDVAPPRELFDQARAAGLEPGLAVHSTELVDAIAAAAVDPERIGRWGRDAYALVEQRFSLQRMLDAYAALYRESPARS